MRYQNRYSNIVVLFFILPVLLIFLFGSPAFADYQKGLDAAKSGDYATALKEWKPLAEQGNANAQNGLGVLYYFGNGVAQDYKAALRWYKLAAEQGNAEAQFYLGGMYVKGEGIAQDYTEAVRWFRNAADQRHPGAQFMLGIMYVYGEGVVQDETKAVAWYSKAAEQGFPNAQHELGRMYYAGRGAPQDKVQAYVWVSLAAARRHIPSKKRVYSLASDMTPAQVVKAQKIAWEWEKKHSESLLAIEFHVKSSFVIVDQSDPAYTIFTGVSKESSEKELAKIKNDVSEKEKVVLMTWVEFVKVARDLVNSRIIIHEYLEYGVDDGIVCLVGKAPGAPWGQTWNGGIAFTSYDYQHTREIYQLYQEDPGRYEQGAKRDPRADPINPGGHLPAFGCI